MKRRERTLIKRRRLIEKLIREDGADRADAIGYAGRVYGLPPTEAERHALGLPADGEVLSDAAFQALSGRRKPPFGGSITQQNQ